MNYKQFKKGDTLFLNKLPRTEDSRGNATYIRFCGFLPGDKPVHEVHYQSDTWKVGDSDILSVHEALAETARQYKGLIDATRKPGMKLVSLAAALSISETTLRKRLALIQNHLPKTP